MRMSNNLGISIGPLIGRLPGRNILYACILLRGSRDDHLQPAHSFFGPGDHYPGLINERKSYSTKGERFAGYPAIFRDRAFISFLISFTLVSMCAVLMWTMMPVYANRTFGISEDTYKWIPATNAIMVVTLQTLTTQFTKRYQAIDRPLSWLGLLCGCGWQCSLCPSFPWLLDRNCHYDDWRADPSAYLQHLRCQPRPDRQTRPLHEPLWPYLAGWVRHRPALWGNPQ